jgi:hypothetical protein
VDDVAHIPDWLEKQKVIE